MPGNQRQGVIIRAEPLGLKHLAQAVSNGPGPDAPEVEALETGHHRRGCGGNLVRLGCGEDEDYTRGWLFQHLQQRVPRLAGEHVGFIDDIDLVMPFLRSRVHGALTKVAGIIHPAIAGGIDFHHVELADRSRCGDSSRTHRRDRQSRLDWSS